MREVSGPPPIDIVLRHQGLVPFVADSRDQLLLPPRLIDADNIIPNDLLDRFRAAFGRLSFRKLARTLTAAHGEVVSFSRLAGIAKDSLQHDLVLLADIGAVEQDEAGAKLVRQVDNIGPTLEWYVADLCERELKASAQWAVHLKGLPAGGDYDVLASLTFGVLYVETKTAPPQKVTDAELVNFLVRLADIQPDMAVLLVDTDDDLTALVKRMNAIVGNPMEATASAWPKFQCWVGCPHNFIPLKNAAGVYAGDPLTYVVNAHSAILTQLRRCLRHHHLVGRSAFISQHVPDPVEVLDHRLSMHAAIV